MNASTAQKSEGSSRFFHSFWKDTRYPHLYEDKFEMKLCNYFSKGKKDCNLIIIHHLHDASEPFINSLGKCYNIKCIIPIPYSSKPEVIKRLRKRYNVVCVNSTNEISSKIKEQVQNTFSQLIISEIGGYSSQISKFLDDSTHVLGVIEDTSQGHWNWQKKKVKKIKIISIANSLLKRYEDPFVAQSIIDGIEKYLDLNKLPNIEKRKIQILGYGNIGIHLARLLEPISKELKVYDKSSIKNLMASVYHNSVKDFSSSDLIIGVTGKQSIKFNDRKKIKEGTLIFSGSSKKVEIDSRLNPANKGEPINLRYSVIPSKILDIVYGSIIYAVNKTFKKEGKPGLQNLCIDDELFLSKMYKKLY